jgi:putative transcriptional regulator
LEETNSLEAEIKSQKLLLASPFMFDAYFRRSVILMCEHKNDEGSLGYILNKKMGITLGSLIEEFQDFPSEVYYGGPVGTDTLHYIHNVGHLLPDSVKIVEGLYWHGNFERLKELILTKQIEPSNIRFFVGYSGWAEGQLQAEMKEQSWLLGQVQKEYTFSEEKNLWTTVLQNEGGAKSIIGQIPDEENLN